MQETHKYQVKAKIRSIQQRLDEFSRQGIIPNPPGAKHQSERLAATVLGSRDATVLTMHRLSLGRLSLIYLRIGNLTFGGGDPTMAALYSELVVTNRWLSHEQYGLVYGLARVTPGTNVLAFCAGTGWLLLGWPGAVAAVLAATVPSAILVLLLTAGYESWKSNPLAMAAIAGDLAAAVGMMATSAWQLLRPHLAHGRWLRGLTVFAGSVILSFYVGLSPIPVLGLAALVGFLWRVPPQS